MCEHHRVLAGGLDQNPWALPQPPLLSLSSLGLRSPFKAGGSQSGAQEKDTALMRAFFGHTQASTLCPDPAVQVPVATQHRSRASEPPRATPCSVWASVCASAKWSPMAWDQPPRVPAGPWTTGSGGVLGSQNSIAHPGPPSTKQRRLGVEAVEGGELSLLVSGRGHCAAGQRP